MNNLNDPPRWNIQPDARGRGAGAGDGNQWNYALLVPMLGLAAFRKLHKVCVYVCVCVLNAPHLTLPLIFNKLSIYNRCSSSLCRLPCFLQ